MTSKKQHGTLAAFLSFLSLKKSPYKLQQMKQEARFFDDMQQQRGAR